MYVQTPTAATMLVFRTTAQGRSDVVALGPRTRGTYHAEKPLAVCVRVQIPPGRVRSTLGVSPERLVNRAVLLTELWGHPADRLTAALAASPRTAADRLADELARRGGGDGGLIGEVLDGLTADTRLPEVAVRAGVSERRLRTLVTREVGLSPKQVARIARLRKVLALAGTETWASVAGTAGFYDQAHMITDFRALMGVTPAAYVSGRRPAASPCTEVMGRTALLR